MKKHVIQILLFRTWSLHPFSLSSVIFPHTWDYTASLSLKYSKLLPLGRFEIYSPTFLLGCLVDNSFLFCTSWCLNIWLAELLKRTWFSNIRNWVFFWILSTQCHGWYVGDGSEFNQVPLLISFHESCRATRFVLKHSEFIAAFLTFPYLKFSSLMFLFPLISLPPVL